MSWLFTAKSASAVLRLRARALATSSNVMSSPGPTLVSSRDAIRSYPCTLPGGGCHHEAITDKRLDRLFVPPPSIQCRCRQSNLLLCLLPASWPVLFEEGVSGLYRRRRSDRGAPRKKHADSLARAVVLKKEEPNRSAEVINQILEREFGRQVPRSTLYCHLRREGVRRFKGRSSKLAVRCRVNSISDSDKRILEQWRQSSNKKLWDRAVAILDHRDSTLEEISKKTERAVRTLRRWIQLFRENEPEVVRRPRLT
jgi:hypothetical protein